MPVLKAMSKTAEIEVEKMSNSRRHVPINAPLLSDLEIPYGEYVPVGTYLIGARDTSTYLELIDHPVKPFKIDENIKQPSIIMRNIQLRNLNNRLQSIFEPTTESDTPKLDYAKHSESI